MHATRTLFRALSNRRFATLWAGQTLSRLGDFLYQVALAWWVLKQTGSAAAMAGVMIFAFVPTLIVMLLGGVAADRFPRIRVMLLSDLLRGLAALAVGALALTGRLELLHVYALSLCFGLVDAFFQPAYTAIVPDLVADEDLSSANSLTSFSAQAGRIAGPPLGAALIAFAGPAAAFGLNAFTFFLSALFLLPLLRHEPPPANGPTQPDQPPAGLVADIRDGLGTVLATPWLWISIALFALTNVALAGPYSISLPFLVDSALRGDVALLGALYAFFAGGYVIGGVWLGRKRHIRRPALLIYGGTVIAGLMLALFGLPLGLPLVPLLAVAALINGAALEVGSLAWIQSLQERVPREKLGRVASVDNLGSFMLLPIGFALAGWATELIGPRPVFLIGGLLTALVAAFAYRLPGVRVLDEPEGAQAGSLEPSALPAQS